MKKILVVMLILITSLTSYTAKGGISGSPDKEPTESEEPIDSKPSDSILGGEKAYVVVPKDFNDLYVIAMDSSHKKYGYGLTEAEKDEITFLNDINVSSEDYYGNLNILEISTEATDTIKLVVGYKIPNKNKYVLLSSDNINETKLMTNYKDGDTLRIVNLTDYTTYSDFPGYRASEDELMTGIKVGTEEMGAEDRVNPSNIIKKFGEIPGGGDGGVNIHPSNDSKEFMMISEDEKIDGEYKVWVFKKGPHDPSHYIQINNGNDLIGKNISKVILTTVANIDEQYLEVDEKILTLQKKTTYTFEGNFKVNMKHDENGSSGWFFYILDGNPSVSPSPSEKELEEVYVVESEGLHYEGSVKMTSGNKALKKRESFVEMDVLDGKGIKIKSIKE